MIITLLNTCYNTILTSKRDVEFSKVKIHWANILQAIILVPYIKSEDITIFVFSRKASPTLGEQIF